MMASQEASNKTDFFEAVLKFYISKTLINVTERMNFLLCNLRSKSIQCLISVADNGFNLSLENQLRHSYFQFYACKCCKVCVSFGIVSTIIINQR